MVVIDRREGVGDVWLGQGLTVSSVSTPAPALLSRQSGQWGDELEPESR